MSLELFEQFVRTEVVRNPSLGQALQLKSNLHRCSQQFGNAIAELHYRLIKGAVQLLFSRVSSARLQELSSACSSCCSCETSYITSDSSERSPYSRSTGNERCSSRWDAQSNNSQTIRHTQRSPSRRRSSHIQNHKIKSGVGGGVGGGGGGGGGGRWLKTDSTKDVISSNQRQQHQQQYQNQPGSEPEYQQQQQHRHHNHLYQEQQHQQSHHQQSHHQQSHNQQGHRQHIHHQQGHRKASYATQQQQQHYHHQPSPSSQPQPQSQPQLPQQPQSSQSQQQQQQLTTLEGPTFNYPTAGHHNRQTMAGWYIANMDAKLSNLMRLFELIYRDTLRMCGACPSDLRQLRNALPDPTTMSMQQRTSGPWRPNFMNCKIDFLLHIAAMVYRNTQDVRRGCNCVAPAADPCGGSPTGEANTRTMFAPAPAPEQQLPPPPAPPPELTGWAAKNAGESHHAATTTAVRCCGVGFDSKHNDGAKQPSSAEQLRQARRSTSRQRRRQSPAINNNSNTNVEPYGCGGSRHSRGRRGSRLFKAVRRSSALVVSPDGLSQRSGASSAAFDAEACQTRLVPSCSSSRSSSSSSSLTTATAAATDAGTETDDGTCLRVDIKMPL